MIRLLALLGVATLAFGQEQAALMEVTWKSAQASPPPQFAAAEAQWLPAFRASLQVLPESVIVPMALSQPQLLGLPSASAQQLTPLINQRYELMGKDPLFSKAASHLSYCFGETKPSLGRARVYCPAKHSDSTAVILFLHGYGGSFLWYQHWLAERFKDHVIICPAYGINTSTIPPAYMEECLAATAQKLGHPLARPWLVGLSAGGFGVQRVFATSSNAYQGLAVLAAFPWDRQFSSLTDKASRIGFLAGEREVFVSDGTWKRSTFELKQRYPKLTTHLVPQGDHFFMLTHADDTAKWLGELMGR